MNEPLEQSPMVYGRELLLDLCEALHLDKRMKIKSITIYADACGKASAYITRYLRADELPMVRAAVNRGLITPEEVEKIDFDNFDGAIIIDGVRRQ